MAITAAERETLLSELTRTSDSLATLIQSLTPAQWEARLNSECWSVRGIVEHLVLTEERILRMILVQAKRGAQTGTPVRTDNEVLQLTGTVVRKATAPEPLEPKGIYATTGDGLQAFERVRQETRRYAAETEDRLRETVQPHPGLGLMDLYQWLLFVSAHGERHEQQIRHTLETTSH